MQRRDRLVNDKQPPAQKMAKNMSVFAFLGCLVIIGVIFVYYQHKNGDKAGTEKVTVASEVQKLAQKDLEMGYPETPTEVMKYFGRLNQCLYNTKGLEGESFEKLFAQLRTFYSQSLLDQNTLQEHEESLQAEIQEFQDKKRRIVNYTVDKSSSVQYKQIEGRECAFVQLAFFMSENGSYSKSFQDYILVKEDKRWKILAFRKDLSPDKNQSKS